MAKESASHNQMNDLGYRDLSCWREIARKMYEATMAKESASYNNLPYNSRSNLLKYRNLIHPSLDEVFFRCIHFTSKSPSAYLSSATMRQVLLTNPWNKSGGLVEHAKRKFPALRGMASLLLSLQKWPFRLGVLCRGPLCHDGISGHKRGFIKSALSLRTMQEDFRTWPLTVELFSLATNQRIRAIQKQPIV